MDDDVIIFKIGDLTYKYSPSDPREDCKFMIFREHDYEWLMCANSLHEGEYFHDYLKMHLKKEMRKRKLERYNGK